MYNPPVDASVDVKDWIDSRPVSVYQWLILALCFLIVLFDGFDVTVMGFIAPSLMQDWGGVRCFWPGDECSQSASLAASSWKIRPDGGRPGCR